MINAINHGKTSIEVKEDTKTSMIVGTLLHLPTILLWEIIRRACRDGDSILPKECGHIRFVDFWPEWSVEGPYQEKITNEQRVEPDVFISFEKFDLIIEAKIDDGNLQSPTQWCNEINSFFNEYGKKRQLFFIALGGNGSLCPEKNSGIDILKCSWSNLMIAIETSTNKLMKHQIDMDFDDSILRILNELISIFVFFGISHFWLENIDFEKYHIEIDNKWKLWKKEIIAKQ